MGEKEINIAISTDENYAKYCIVTIVSVKETQKDFDKINVFVLSKNLSPKTQKLFQDLNTENFKVKLIDISTIDVSSIKIDIPRKRTLPDLTYCRVFIADILKDIEKILYLDCDVIVKDNLLPLWQTDLTNYYFAAVEDHCSESILKKHKLSHKKHYFNSGVLLMNLKKWREGNAINKIISFVKKPYVTLKFHDQDILNFSFDDEDILFIDKKWNFQQYFYKKDFPKCAIIHYISAHKPWNLFKIKVYYRSYYWNILKKTAFKNEIYKYYLANIFLGLFYIGYKTYKNIKLHYRYKNRTL